MSSTISIVCSPKVENSQIIEVFGGGNIYKYCTKETEDYKIFKRIKKSSWVGMKNKKRK